MIKTAKYVLFFIVMMFVVSPGLSLADNQWKMVKDKNDIQVFTRSVEGFSVKQFKGVTYVNAPMEVIYEVINDSKNTHHWFGDCLRQKTTEQINATSKYIYHEVKVPILKDRNLIGKVEFTPDYAKATLRTRIMAITKNKIPEEFWKKAWQPATSKHVRITELNCTIDVISEGASKSKVVYEVLVDPAGFIPGWVANYFAESNPITTLSNLKKMVEKQVYWDRAGKLDKEELTSQRQTNHKL